MLLDTKAFADERAQLPGAFCVDPLTLEKNSSKMYRKGCIAGDAHGEVMMQRSQFKTAAKVVRLSNTGTRYCA